MLQGLGRGLRSPQLLSVLLAAGLASPSLAVGTAPGDIVGKVVNVHRRVEVLPLGRGRTWKRIAANYQIRQKDILRTGPRGRARIQFADRFDKGNAGPTVVNVGSSSEIEMTQFDVQLGRKKSTGLIGLIKGTLRAFTKNFGPGSKFQVRTGSSLCGIRGSEEVVSYDPDGGSTGRTTQSCFSGSCFTLRDGSRAKPLQRGFQRYMPDPSDPRTWRDTRLTEQDKKNAIQRTEQPGNNGKTESELFNSSNGTGGGAGAPGGEWGGVRWTSAGLPDCQAEVTDLMLNQYKWSEIKEYRDFTFYRDELINDRFVVSGMIKTECPGKVLDVEVSVDGGASWVRARFSEESETFRYEFDPSAFRDLDLRVRPTFRKSVVEQYRKSQK